MVSSTSTILKIVVALQFSLLFFFYRATPAQMDRMDPKDRMYVTNLSETLFQSDFCICSFYIWSPAPFCHLRYWEHKSWPCQGFFFYYYSLKSLNTLCYIFSVLYQGDQGPQGVPGQKGEIGDVVSEWSTNVFFLFFFFNKRKEVFLSLSNKDNHFLCPCQFEDQPSW